MEENKQKEKILVSACLAGIPCRMDGKAKPVPQIIRMLEEGTAVPVCPEELGGLPTPRTPSERRGGRVFMRTGEDVTEAFERGAQEAMRLCRENGCRQAILKAKSPSCGCGLIYDGSFTGQLIPGNGVLAQKLLDEGISIRNETDLREALPAAVSSEERRFP